MILLSVIVLLTLHQGSQAICEDCKVLNLGSSSGNGKKYLQWEDIFNLTLAPKYAGVHWASHGHYAYESSEDGFWKIEVKTSERIKKYFDIDELYGMDFEISPDEDFAILYEITKSKYRHSFYANYWLVDLRVDRVNGVRPNVTVDPIGNNTIQYCGFAPTGHTVIAVADFDLYTKKDPMATGDDAWVRHTEDGEDNIIFNGVPDWVYEEEVVATYYSNYPSPDSRFVAFSKTNATGVKHVKFPIYGKETYATILDYEYPKSGYKNPTVEVWMADLEDDDKTAYNIPTPQEVLDWGEHYLYSVSWANNDTVVCEWWNRNQTKINFYQCKASRSDTDCTIIFKQDSEGHGWLDWWKTPFWYFDGLDSFATLLPSNQGIEGDFKHVCLFTRESDGTWSRKFLTSGTYDVLSIYGQINEPENDKQYLFYYASYGGQMFRHVFQLNIQTAESTCLSCDGYCGYGGASFSADMKMYRLICSGPVTPYVQLKEIDSSWARVLEANYDVEAMLRTFNLPKREYLTESIGGFDVNIQRIAPYDFDENGSKRYPVLVYVYGGPDSGNVRDTFPHGDLKKEFHNYLANGDPSKPSFLVYYVDVRGTIGRGDNFRFPLYKQFGIVEVGDTLRFLELLSQKSYVDDARMAIWGWSYGGYVTSRVAATGSKLVQAAIAVAPVTSFRFYDTIYTERYMSLPKYNPVYDTGDCLHGAANFSLTNYFMIHGTADDNVHYTNSARLAFELVENNVQFRMHAYTDREHSLKGVHTKRHLYTMMREFLFDVLNLNDDYMGTYKMEL